MSPSLFVPDHCIRVIHVMVSNLLIMLAVLHPEHVSFHYTAETNLGQTLSCCLALLSEVDLPLGPALGTLHVLAHVLLSIPRVVVVFLWEIKFRLLEKHNPSSQAAINVKAPMWVQEVFTKSTLEFRLVH